MHAACSSGLLGGMGSLGYDDTYYWTSGTTVAGPLPLPKVEARGFKFQSVVPSAGWIVEIRHSWEFSLNFWPFEMC